jgi:hypothetical protein
MTPRLMSNEQAVLDAIDRLPQPATAVAIGALAWPGKSPEAAVNNVKVAICRLRAKGFKFSCIRNRGYTFLGQVDVTAVSGTSQAA